MAGGKLTSPIHLSRGPCCEATLSNNLLKVPSTPPLEIPTALILRRPRPPLYSLSRPDFSAAYPIARRPLAVTKDAVRDGMRPRFLLLLREGGVHGRPALRLPPLRGVLRQLPPLVPTAVTPNRNQPPISRLRTFISHIESFLPVKPAGVTTAVFLMYIARPSVEGRPYLHHCVVQLSLRRSCVRVVCLPNPRPEPGGRLRRAIQPETRPWLSGSTRRIQYPRSILLHAGGVERIHSFDYLLPRNKQSNKWALLASCLQYRARVMR